MVATVSCEGDHSNVTDTKTTHITINTHTEVRKWQQL